MSPVLRISRQETPLALDDRDGYWRVTVEQRLRDTERLAARLERVYLPPYVPNMHPMRVPGGWETRSLGLVRASTIRAVRWLVGEYATERTDCVGWQVLALVDALRREEPGLRWADLGRLAAWPIALRLDAKRLRGRLGPLTRATWCRWCDDAPWASGTRSCLWCERQGRRPVAVPDVPMRRAA